YIVIMLLGFIGIRFFTLILRLPKIMLSTIILVFCVVGTYSLGNNMFEVWIMLIAGIIGYFMQKFGFPATPIILAIILGPKMETNLRESLVLFDGEFMNFFTRPISAVFIIISILTLFSPILKPLFS